MGRTEDNYSLPNHWPMMSSLHYLAGYKKPFVFDPKATAKKEAAAIKADRENAIYGGLNRTLRDAPHVGRKELLAELLRYHRDSRERVPSFQQYPEAKFWVDYTLTLEKELQRMAGLSEEELAIVKSLGAYLTFRGFRRAGLKPGPSRQTEKCRIAFLVDSDEGPMTVKNVDDPLASDWHPMPPLPTSLPASEFFWDQVNWVADGVGSGLHIDDEPEQLFPLPVFTMCGQHAETTREVVDFLRRYSQFWGGGNVVVYDKSFDVVAIEKTSRNFFQPYELTNGQTHVSGMACRDPNSPQGKYQRARRDEYRLLYGLPEDGPDQTFWRVCDRQEQSLARGLNGLGKPPCAADLIKLFRTPYPDGLCKTGKKVHPAQPVGEYTQVIYAIFFARRQYRRFRLDAKATMASEPEICQFG